jgi:glutamate synthase (NADPH/NADH) small chain
MLLTQAVGYETDRAGRLAGVRVVRTRLGEPGGDGRRRPVPVAGSESVLPVSLAIEAVGEAVEASTAEVLAGVALAGGTAEVDGETFATSRPGVYAAGDLVSGGTTVAQALWEGRQAGRAICELLAPGGSK